jgi:hypothetical protein
MQATAVRVLSCLAFAASSSLFTSCSTGPEPPKLGTPAYYWSAARETYAAGDYLKTVEHLEAISKSQNEYTARAQPWYLVMTSGLAKGYMDLADQFEYGAKANRGNPTPFRREMSAYRSYAKQLSLQFAFVFENFEKNFKEAKVPLAFPYPTGSALPAPQLSKIASGELLQPAILDDVRRQHLKTAVLLAASRAVGAADDTARAQELFKQQPVETPRETFLLGMADAFNDESQLYVRTKLDEPNRVKFFASHALDLVKTLPQTKETKDLTAKIEKNLKLVKAE